MRSFPVAAVNVHLLHLQGSLIPSYYIRKKRNLYATISPQVRWSVAMTAKRPISPFTPGEQVPPKFAIPAFMAEKHLLATE